MTTIPPKRLRRKGASKFEVQAHRLAVCERPDTREKDTATLIQGMNSFEAIITDAVEISTIGGRHFRLMPGQYRVTPEMNGGALLVPMQTIKGFGRE